MLRRPAIMLMVLAVGVLSSRSGWAQISDVRPNLEASTLDDFNQIRTDTDDDVTNTSFIRQSHNMGLDVPLSAAFLLSYNMRYTKLDTRRDTAPSVTNSSTENFEPRVEVLWDNPFFIWNNGFFLRKDDIESDVQGVTRTAENYFSRLSVDEGLFFPSLLGRYEWLRNSDQELVPQADSNVNRVNVDLFKRVGPVRASYSFDASRTDNDISQTIGDRLSHDGSLGYSGDFFWNLLSVVSNYRISAQRTISHLLPQSEDDIISRDPNLGLYQDGLNDPDSTPSDPTDDNLDKVVPDLIDDDTATAVVVDGNNIDLKDKLQNLGVRFPTNVDVETLFVHIVDQQPPTSEASLDGITWKVFVGTAADSWVEIAVLSSDFDVVESRFEITIASTSGRFFRVRNETETEDGIIVTEFELRGVAVEEIDRRVRRVLEDYNQNFTGGLTFQPFRVLSFSYNFLYNTSTLEPEGVGDLLRIHSGSGSFSPHPLLGISGRILQSYSDSSGVEIVPKVRDSYSVAVTSRPLPTFSHSISMSRDDEHEQQELDVSLTRNESLLYSMNARIYRNLTVSSDFTWSRSWDLLDGLPAEITARNLLRIDAGLMPGFRISGDFRAGRTRGGDLPNRRRIENGEFLVSYRPVDRISMDARLLFFTEEAKKGLDQDYSLNWIILRGGALDLLFDYGYGKEEIGDDDETHSARVTANWKINRKSTLNVGWTFASENNGTRSVSQTIRVNFSLRL